MNNDQQTLRRLLEDPTAQPDPAWVMDMLYRFPTFYIPALLTLKRSPQGVDAPTMQRLQAAVTLNCADRQALVDYIDPLGAGWSTIYPVEKPREVTTEQTIDRFLDIYGQQSSSDEDAVLEKLLFNPVPADYFAGVDQPIDPADPLALPPELTPRQHNADDNTKPGQPQPEQPQPERPKPEQPKPEPRRPGLVPSQQPADKPIREKSPKEPAEEPSLMESLAKIFIKQGRYERALEIISKLSLDNSEKSAYFADQIRFLQKLIENKQKTK